MCGICGFNWEDKSIIKDMIDSIAHRGPDQDGTYTDSSVSLGHKRLSIIDLSENGRQPMCNEEGDIWIVYNGEIYNFHKLRAILEQKGHVFKSDTDTEVIVHAYEEYGLNCVDYLEGMFAFAIWDSRTKKIVIFRDRLGIKPLFYYYNKEQGRFVFGSEIKSIIRNPIVKREFNATGMNQLIDYAFTINGETLLKNIREILPGHILIYEEGGVLLKKYWEVRSDIKYESEDYFVKRIRSSLKDAVEKRLVSDVPIGASLSGGLDSSAVVAFMSQITEQPVKTFTIRFNDDSDETAEAKLVADYFNTDHQEVEVDLKELTQHFPTVVWHAETAFGRPSLFSGYFLSRGINKKGVVVDLCGSGGDELFAGYNRYKYYLDTPENSSLTNTQRAIKVASNYFPTKESKESFFQKDFLELADPSLNQENSFLPYLDRTERREHINALLEYELRTELQGIQLWRDDRMSMAHSHEVRVPLVDHNFVDLAMQIPASMKWKGDNKKYIFQKAMKGLIPDATVNRKKLPFGMPLARYFDEEFLDIADSIISKSKIMTKGFIKKEKVVENIRRIKSGAETADNSRRQILFFTTLEVFNELFLEEDSISKKDLSISNFL